MPAIVSASTPNLTLEAALGDGTVPNYLSEVFLTGDSYRVVFFSDGTSLKGSTSQNGTSWSAPTTLVAMTTISNAMHIEYANGVFWFWQVNGQSIQLNKVTYTNGGTLGSWGANITALSSLTGTIGAVRVEWDPSCQIFDSQHTPSSATGVFHVLVDAGSTWQVFAIDPNSSNTNGIKTLCSTSITTGITAPTYRTNIVVYQPGKVFAISPAGTRWYGVEIDYVYTDTSTYTNTPGASSGSMASGGVNFTSALADGQWYAGRNDGGTELEGSSPPAAASTWGMTFSGAPGANAVITTGQWTLNGGNAFRLNSAVGSSAALNIQARIYENTGSGKILRATLGPGEFHWQGNQWNGSISTSSVTGWTMGPSSSLYVEVDIQLAPNPVFPNSIASSTYTLAYTPVMTFPLWSTRTLVPSGNQKYTASAMEQPTLPFHATGAALAQTDYSSSAGVDIFAYNPLSSPQITTQRRPSTGTYNSPVNLGPSTNILQATAPSVLVSPSTPSPNGGDATVFCLANFSGLPHVAAIKRTSGVWGSLFQIDTSAGTTQKDILCNSTGAVGTGFVYVDGGGPYNLKYEDGATATAVTPTACTNVGFAGYTGTSATPPYFLLPATMPQIRFQFNVNSYAILAAYRIVIKHSSDTITDYDSGSLSYSGTVTNGMMASVTYAGPALTNGTLYNIYVYAYESFGNLVSPVSAAVSFQQYTTPTLTYTDSAVLTAPSVTLHGVYTQAESQAATSYQVQFTDQNFTGGGLGQAKLVYDSGVQPLSSVASGAAYALPAIDCSGFLIQGHIYTLSISLGFAVNGALLLGTVQPTVQFLIAPPPSPGNVTATPTPGTTPTAGGYVRLTYGNAGPAQLGSMRMNPVRLGVRTTFVDSSNLLNFYYRLNGATVWTLYAGPLNPNGKTNYDYYSVPHNVAYDYGVSVTGPYGNASPIVAVKNVTLSFRLGFWINDPTSPTTCLELGMFDSSTSNSIAGGGSGTSTLPAYQRVRDQDFFIPYNRKLPVFSMGTARARKLKSAVSYILDSGFEIASIAQLDAWDTIGQPLQLRDNYGNLFFIVLTDIADGADTHPMIRAVILEYHEADQATYGLLGNQS